MTLLPSINRWRICISGFLQHDGRRNGVMDLWQKMRAVESDSETCVELQTWDTNWKRYAERIWLCRRNGMPSVRIFAYSWGAGWGFIQLSRALRERGIHVEAAVLSDPVYRHRYWLGQWRAFCPWATIRVPCNVEKVHWFRQSVNLPAGHNLQADDPDRTDIYAPRQLDRTHQYMDDSPEFHDLSMFIASKS